MFFNHTNKNQVISRVEEGPKVSKPVNTKGARKGKKESYLGNESEKSRRFKKE